MTSLILYSDINSEVYSVSSSFDSNSLTQWPQPPPQPADTPYAVSGNAQTVGVTASLNQTASLDAGTLVYKKETSIDQQGNVYGIWQTAFNLNGNETDAEGNSLGAGVIAAVFGLTNNVFTGVNQIDPASLYFTDADGNVLYYAVPKAQYFPLSNPVETPTGSSSIVKNNVFKFPCRILSANPREVSPTSNPCTIPPDCSCVTKLYIGFINSALCSGDFFGSQGIVVKTLYASCSVVKYQIIFGNPVELKASLKL
jgi:hypothetical protein